MNKLYTQKSLYKASVTVLVLGILYNLLRSYGYVKKYDKMLNSILVIALLSVVGRDFFLPFLGDTVIPSGALSNSTPTNASVNVTVQVPPKSTVLYWAAEPEESDTVQMPWTAYKGYSNAGVTQADDSGVATLSVRDPQAYKTPWGKRLKPHVHYRFSKTQGMYSKVFTSNI